jgi:hypothetical protein
MFVYRIRVEQLTRQILSMLKMDFDREEPSLRAHYEFRDLNAVADDAQPNGNLDIYVALDDGTDNGKLGRLIAELRSMIDMKLPARETEEPRVSTELIRI